MNDLMRCFPELQESEQAKKAIAKALRDGVLNLSTYGAMATIEKTLMDIELAKLQKQERLLRLQIMVVELEASQIKLAKAKDIAI